MSAFTPGHILQCECLECLDRGGGSVLAGMGVTYPTPAPRLPKAHPKGTALAKYHAVELPYQLGWKRRNRRAA